MVSGTLELAQFGFNGAAGVNPRMVRFNYPAASALFRFNGAAGVNPRMERRWSCTGFLD